MSDSEKIEREPELWERLGLPNPKTADFAEE